MQFQQAHGFRWWYTITVSSLYSALKSTKRLKGRTMSPDSGFWITREIMFNCIVGERSIFFPRTIFCSWDPVAKLKTIAIILWCVSSSQLRGSFDLNTWSLPKICWYTCMHLDLDAFFSRDDLVESLSRMHCVCSSYRQGYSTMHCFWIGRIESSACRVSSGRALWQTHLYHINGARLCPKDVCTVGFVSHQGRPVKVIP